MTDQNLSDKAAAAAYRSIKAILPEILHRGAIAALESTAPAQGSGLSWCNIPSADLLKLDSELANCEKLRRSLEAVELWNLKNGRSQGYAPTGALLARIAGIAQSEADQWLARPGIAADVALLMAGLNIGSKGPRVFNTMKNESERKADPRSVIRWHDRYGDYEWERS